MCLECFRNIYTILNLNVDTVFFFIKNELAINIRQSAVLELMFTLVEKQYWRGKKKSSATKKITNVSFVTEQKKSCSN